MITFQVNDMTCGHCVATITKAVTGMDPAAKLNVDLGAHKVAIESSRSPEEIAGVICDAGYTPVLVD